MTDKSHAFYKIATASFQSIAKTSQVFVTDVDGDTLWERYLAAFPEGTNPVFRKKTEHDCSMCRQFIRRAGNVVSVDDHGAVRTVWDEAAEKAPYPYSAVATVLRDVVRGTNISDLFRVSYKENSFGAAATRSMDCDGKALTWNHLHTDAIPKVLQATSPDQVRGEYRTTVQVFTRVSTSCRRPRSKLCCRSSTRIICTAVPSTRLQLCSSGRHSWLTSARVRVTARSSCGPTRSARRRGFGTP